MQKPLSDEDKVRLDAAPPSATAWVSLVILALAYVLSYIDRKLPFILADAIKADLGLSDTQVGLLTGAMFAIVYSTVALPMARLSDQRSRKLLITGAILVWSAMTAAGGLAKTFWQLALSRMGVAAGESVCTPAAHSMIGDYFAPRYRARAMGIYVAGAHIGALSGLALGGWINEWADWRMAMFLLGAPGLVLALIALIGLREPPRMNREGVDLAEPRPSFWAVLGQIMRQPVLVHLILGSTMAGVAGGGFQAFLPSHMIRTFGMGTAQVGLLLGITWGLGGLTGALLGGLAGDWLRRRAHWMVLAFITVGEIVSIPCFVAALLMGHYGAFLVLAFVGQVAAGVNSGPIYATLQALMKSNVHATTTAIYLFCVSGLGLALGPLITGMLSDSLARLGPAGSLQMALLILCGMKLWAVGHYSLSTLSLRRREAGVRGQVV